MSTPKTRKVKYTGKEKTSSLIDNGVPVEWKPGEVKDVYDSKVRNHTKYPYFEEVEEKPKAEKQVKEPKKGKEEPKEEEVAEPEASKEDEKPKKKGKK